MSERECNHKKLVVLDSDGTYREVCRFCRKPWAETRKKLKLVRKPKDAT